MRSKLEVLEQRVLFAAGDLDPTFGGGDGIAQIGNTYAGRVGLDAVVLPDGKTFVVGIASGGGGANREQAYLARYNASGSLDTTFSGDGRVTFHFGDGGDAEARRVLLRPDGKIVVAGHAGTGPGTNVSRLGVALLNANGTFDTAFGGGDGRAHVDVPGGDFDWIHSLSLAPGNKLVAAVGASSTGGDRFVAMRLNANGTPDATFGGTGFVSLNPGPYVDHAHSAVVTPDGGVLVGGMRYVTNNQNGNDQYESTLVKLRPDGHLDTAWGGGDAQVHGTFPQNSVLSLALAPGGKVVAAGHSVVARLNPDGTPDASFGGGDGVVETDLPGLSDMVVTGDGKVYLTGRTNLSHNTDTGVTDGQFTVKRLTSAGNPDTSWSGDGAAHANFYSDDDTPQAIALQSDGKVVVVGTAYVGGGYPNYRGVAVARFTAGGSLDATFSADGKTNNDVGTVTRTGGDLVIDANGMTIVGGSQQGAASNAAGFDENFFLARFKADGSADTAFGTNGRVTTDLGGVDAIRDLLLLPDGKMLALGHTRAPSRTDYDLALARYNANGTLDTTFSGDGKMVLGLGGFDQGVKLARLADGDVLLSAITWGNPNGGNYALVRLNPDGSRDNTLGGTGIKFNNFSAAFLPQADGKILIGGTEQTQEFIDGAMFLTRLNPDGSVDGTYANGGRTPYVGFGPEDDAYAIDMTYQDGKVLVLSNVSVDSRASYPFVGLFRFTAEGAVDTSFGGGRYAGTGKSLFLEDDVTRSPAVEFALDPQGRIVIASSPEASGPGDVYGDRFAVYRATPAGERDTTFGVNGRSLVTSIFATTGGLSLTSDGKPVVAGTYYTPFNDRAPGGVAVARLQAGGNTGAGTVELRPDGTLVVHGTDAADRIAVTRDPDGRVAVNVNGNVTRHESVAAAELYGAAGDDVILHQLDDVRAALSGGDGNDLLEGGGDADRLDGGAGDDVLRGRLGDDVLLNGPGADEFHGGTGTRTGAPDDDVILFGGPLSLNIDLNGLADDGAAGERDNVFDDVETIYAGDAADTIVAGYYTGRRIFAGHGNDRITGNSNDQHIDAGAGDDVIDGGYGADVIIGGAGTDTVDYSARTGSGPVKVTLDSAAEPNDGVLHADGTVTERDTVGPDVENVTGTSANDVLLGSELGNVLRGGGGNDVIRGAGGSDRLDGGDGDDLLDGGTGADEFIGGPGTDLADYSYRTENLTIGIGSAADDGAAGEGDNVRTGVENVTTGSGNDTVTGDGARNTLRGNGGDDTVRGLGGDDFINPGAGADGVYGGDGNDTFYVRDGIRDLVLDGGLGTDKAQVDSTDPRTSIEQLIP